jgi:ribosomal protein L28
VIERKSQRAVGGDAIRVKICTRCLRSQTKSA